MSPPFRLSQVRPPPLILAYPDAPLKYSFVVRTEDYRHGFIQRQVAARVDGQGRVRQSLSLIHI